MRLQSPLLLVCTSLSSAFSVSLVQDPPNLLDIGSGGQEPLSAKFPRPVLHKPSETGTIYEQISSNPSFSRLTKALDFVEDVASLLNNSSAQERIKDLNFDPVLTLFKDVKAAFDLLDNLESLSSEEGKHDKWRKALKLILRAILNYHIIPTAEYDTTDLGHNLTYPTNLVIGGVFDDEALRLRVTQTYIPPATKINFFRRISKPNVKATNGIIHVVDGPLFPPPSIFQELYMFPRFFSTLTSALQRSGLTRNLDLRWVRGKGLKGTPLVTIFAPTNRAFEALPRNLRSYLFSPFGERTLKKLLQYHIVPHTVLHSNYFHTSHGHKNTELAPCHGSIQVQGRPYSLILSPLAIFLGGQNANKPPLEPIISIDFDLHSLLANHTIHAHVAQNKINFPFPTKRPYIIDTRIYVNRQLVTEPDIVGLNGAIHVIDKLLDPRGHRQGHHHHGSFNEVNIEDDVWTGWESWLIEWAMQED
ncbi:FAS1 domain-containing protein [Gymnopilus junonius]|uniref:FAS1 domain-containing protein n=1 Tax=Gymnopilus junonius TaxID=109634 RepID=A0A9P5TQ55_GYMJU|nr:FAS1 domain-containing protein [Gymnopilus junonius]